MRHVREIVAPKVVAEAEAEDLLLVVEIIEDAVVGDAVDDGVGVDEVEDFPCLLTAVGQGEDIAVVVDKAEASLVLDGATATRRGR